MKGRKNPVKTIACMWCGQQTEFHSGQLVYHEMERGVKCVGTGYQVSLIRQNQEKERGKEIGTGR